MSSIARISLPQYEHMVESGAFAGEFRQRVELICGEIRQMNPIGVPTTSYVIISLEDSWDRVSDGVGHALASFPTGVETHPLPERDRFARALGTAGVPEFQKSRERERKRTPRLQATPPSHLAA